MSTEIQTAPEQELDTSFPPQEASTDTPEILHQGKAQKRSSFADSLSKTPVKEAAAEKSEEAVAETSAKSEPSAPKDPIAEKIAEKKQSAETTPEKPKSLLDDALNKQQAAKAKKDEKSPEKEKEAKTEEAATVTDKEIEEELANPHISDKRAARIKALHKQWKDADAKAATTAKQLAEKDAKLQELEKKISEAGKAAGVAPEVQAQLDELQQYRRQYEVEKSERYQEFNNAHLGEETSILITLKNAGVKFKGQTWEQTEAYIKEVGGYEAFQKKHPDIARNIREDILGVAESDEISSALSRQKLLKKTQEAWVGGEKKQAKEYFAKLEGEKKAAAEEAAKAPNPEDIQKARKAKLEQWRDKTISEIELFKDSEAPADASDEVRTSTKQNNELKAHLRNNLAANISDIETEEGAARVTLDATLAHFFKKTSDGLAAENDQLRAEIKKLKTAGKTIVKGTQTSAPVSDKPAKTFAEQLERSLASKA